MLERGGMEKTCLLCVYILDKTPILVVVYQIRVWYEWTTAATSCLWKTNTHLSSWRHSGGASVKLTKCHKKKKIHETVRTLRIEFHPFLTSLSVVFTPPVHFHSQLFIKLPRSQDGSTWENVLQKSGGYEKSAVPGLRNHRDDVCVLRRGWHYDILIHV